MVGRLEGKPPYRSVFFLLISIIIIHFFHGNKGKIRFSLIFPDYKQFPQNFNSFPVKPAEFHSFLRKEPRFP